MKVNEIPTPAILVKLDVLKNNIESVQQRANSHGIAMRPHIKAHKIPQIAKMQLDAGAVGVTCAKLGEAKIMADAGVKDILVAYPTVQEYKIRELLDLPAKVYLGFDSVYGAENIDKVSKEKGVVSDVYMIVDTGLERDGMDSPQAAVELANKTRELRNINIMGIFTHEGQAHSGGNREGIRAAGQKAAQFMLDVRDALVDAGFKISVVSTGATPTVYYDATLPGINEWRPGQYVFQDTGMVSLGSDPAECALSVLTTVSSHSSKGRYIIDAGSKVFSSDRSARHPGFGIVKGAPNAVLSRLNEEHGILDAEDGTFSIGQVIEVIPNHCCTTTNLAEKVYVVQGDEVVDIWEVAARAKYV